MIEVTDTGRPAAPGGPSAAPGPGAGRGLVGLRERLALYGGDLDASGRLISGAASERAAAG